MLKKFLFFAGFLLSLWPGKFVRGGAASSPVRLSLSQCLKLASQNNARLAARGYAIEGSKWRLEEANLRFWPVVEYSNRMAPVPTDAARAAESFFEGDLTFLNAAKVGLGVPLYAFGQMTTAQSLAQNGIHAAKGDRRKEENKVHFEVRQLYHGILLANELARLGEEAIGKIDGRLKKEEETREHSPYDILKLKTFRTDLERRLLEAKIKGELAKEALRLQIGFAAQDSFELSEQELKPSSGSLGSLDRYLAGASRSRPEFGLLQVGVDSKRLEYQLEKRKMLPRVGAGGFLEISRTTSDIRNLGARDDFTNPFNYTRAGIGLEIKGQLDFHSSIAKIRRLRQEFRKSEIESDLARDALHIEVKESYLEAKRSKENLRLAEERQKMARQMMFLSKSNLDLGVGEERDYTDALQLVLLTKGEYYKAVYDYNIALAKLQEKAGGEHVP